MTARLAAEIVAGLGRLADPERAKGQQAYMKSAMPFHGVPAPDVRRLVRAALRANPLPSAASWQRAILNLWRNATHREQRYAAVEILLAKTHTAYLTPDTLPVVEELVVSGAWWDFVDALAINAIGPMLRADSHMMAGVLRCWANDGDIWKRRCAILAQLKFNHATDEGLLCAAIEPSLGNREFFLGKAIGWALRQYSKTNPAFVIGYVQTHADRLTVLSKREALKVLVKNGLVDAVP